MSLALLLFACQEHPVPPPTDTDTDADSDTDTDTDTDTDSDADTDTTGTTGETGVQCLGVVNELLPYLEVRDDTGLTCTICNAGEIAFYAGLRNPCQVDIDIEVGRDCLVSGDTISFPNGTAMASAGGCGADTEIVTVPAGGVFEENYATYALDDVGAYGASAELTTRPAPQQVNTNFTLQ
jgi:hypothetical protein